MTCSTKCHPVKTISESITITKEHEIEFGVRAQTLTMTPEKLRAICDETERRQIGGALFSDPSKWQRHLPQALMTRWQEDGGAAWSTRPRRPQRVAERPPVCTTEPEVTIISKEMNEQLRMGIVERVQETEEQELEDLKAYQQAWNRHVQTITPGKSPCATATGKSPKHARTSANTTEQWLPTARSTTTGVQPSEVEATSGQIALQNAQSSQSKAIQQTQSDQPQKNNPAIQRVRTQTEQADRQLLSSWPNAQTEFKCAPRSTSTPETPGTGTELFHRRRSRRDHARSDAPMRIEDMQQTFYNLIFTQEKKGEPNQQRVLMECKSSGCNEAVQNAKFKVDNQKTLHGLLKPGDMALIGDFRKFFHLTKLHRRVRNMTKAKFWCMETKKIVRIRYRTLPMGVTASPWIADKGIRPAMDKLKAVGMRINRATDDICLLVETEKIGMLHGYIMFSFLGPVLKAIFSGEKGRYHLSHRFTWYGMTYCTITSVTFVPEDKVSKIVVMCAHLKHILDDPEATVTLRTIEKVKGTLMATVEAVSRCRLMCTGLQMLTTAWPTQNRDHPYQVRRLDGRAVRQTKDDMTAWMADHTAVTDPVLICWNGKHHFCGNPMAVIAVDACPWQGGFTVHETENGPPVMTRKMPFTYDQASHHIALQETMNGTESVVEAVLERGYHHGTLALLGDATASLPTWQNAGGRKPHYTKTADLMERVLRDRCLTLQVYHIEGEKNPADAPSRDLVGLNEYKLNPDIFQIMFSGNTLTWVDAFAARWNNQCDTYFTMQRSDTRAKGFNFMLQMLTPELREQKLWMFPPPITSLCHRLVKRIQTEELTGVLVLPVWEAMPIAEACQMATAMPILFEANNVTFQRPACYSMHSGAGRDQTPNQLSHLLRSSPLKCLLGIPTSGQFRKRGEFLRTWQATLALQTPTRHQTLFTQSDSVQRGASILLAHSQSYDNICRSNHTTLESMAQRLSLILCCATAQTAATGPSPGPKVFCQPCG